MFETYAARAMTDIDLRTALKCAETKVQVVEDLVRHSERMAAVGLLSVGIAHDFNNLLGVILGFGERALSRADGPHASDVENMMLAAQRSADLTRQLLAYGRRDATHKEIVDPVALMTKLATLLQRTIGSHVELMLHITLPVGGVEVDPSRLEQLLMNLVLNARDAIPESGSITLGLAEAWLDDTFVRSHPGAITGRQVVLSVCDTGVGMDDATRSHIFETFFTTKAKGQGTGLGLANVCAIVKECCGHIFVDSELGRGTTFKVYLPRASSGPRSSPPPRRAELQSASHPDRGTVLVAEDDPLLRVLAEHALTAAGYRVRVAASGTEALEACENDGAITLLVTDIVMPGMHGGELVTLARRARPGLKVLCTSGYTVADLKTQGALPGETSFLEKPYLPSLLVRTVQKIMDTARVT